MLSADTALEFRSPAVVLQRIVQEEVIEGESLSGDGGRIVAESGHAFPVLHGHHGFINGYRVQ